VTSQDHHSLDGGTFARLMAPFEPFEATPVIAVAVSGGRDSLALALLAQGWATARGGRVIGLVVDHALRAEAAAEAAAALRVLRQHRIEGTILHWPGAKPSSGLQEAARAARYRLLRDECRRRGILHLLLGHHADDQAETIAMRAVRRSGPDGLAGMAALVEQPEVRVLRPLLGIGRSRLTATLLERGVTWLDDPSNADPRFERARLRAGGRLPLVAPASPGASAKERPRRERSLASAALDTLEFQPDGAMVIDRATFVDLGGDLQARLLSRVAQAVGGGEHPPRRDRLERAVLRLCAPATRGKSGRSQDFTLSACRLLLRQAPQSRRLLWIVHPEHGRRDVKSGAQSLIPAAFFACGARLASHLD
jgi:tRNA(Ile)-lysidine synthase